MTDLTATQRGVLIAAAARPYFSILPLPDRIKGGAATKVVEALIARGFVTQAAATSGEGGPALIATDAGLRAIGVEPRPSPSTAVSKAGDGSTDSARAVRTGTKQAKLIAMLQTADGATIAEIAEATGWQQHTVRGAIAGSLKKRLGLAVTSDTVDGRGRVYRIGR